MEKNKVNAMVDMMGVIINIDKNQNKVMAIVDIVNDYYIIQKTNLNYQNTVDNLLLIIPKVISLIHKIIDEKITFNNDEMEKIKEKCILLYK